MKPNRLRHGVTVLLPLLSAVSVATAFLAGCSGDAGSYVAPGAAQGEVLRALVCERPSVDFGQVWEGAVLKHQFALVVNGGSSSAIEAVKVDCGCTVAELEIERRGAGDRSAYAQGDPIAPGDRVYVNIDYDTRGKRGRAPRTVALYTPQGRVELVVTAEVLPWLQVEPEKVDLPTLRDAEQVHAEFHVSSVDGTPFRLSHLDRGVPAEVQVELEARKPDDEGRGFAWDVHVTLGPNLPRGSHIYPIELLTDQLLPDVGSDGVQPAIKATTYITLRVVGAVSLNPPSVRFGVVDPAETVARTIRVECHDPDFSLPEPVVRLVEVRPASGAPGGERSEDFALAETAAIHVSQVPGANAWDVQLLLTGLDPSIEGTFLGKLLIETGHPSEARIEANVSGIVLVGGAPR